MPPLTALLPTQAAAAGGLDLAALVGPAGWARLPAAVQRRFGLAHADAEYRGSLDLRCSRIGRLFAALTLPFAGPLVGRQAQALPTTVRVQGNGQGGVIWERWFGDTDGQRVRSTKQLGPAGGLMERTEGGLSMALDVFEDQGALVFRSRRYALVWGGLRLPIPNWLSPGVCEVRHADLGQGLFRFTLSMQHPLWGETFHQTGVFTDPIKD